MAALAAVLIVLVPAVPASGWTIMDRNDCGDAAFRLDKYQIQIAPTLSDSYRFALLHAVGEWNDRRIPGLSIVLKDSEPDTTGPSHVNVKMAVERSEATGRTYASVKRLACVRNGSSFYETRLLTVYTDLMDPLDDDDRFHILSHEVGHVLSLDHSAPEDRCATVMYPRYDPGMCAGQMTRPAIDDVAGVLARIKPNLTPGFPADSMIMAGKDALRSGRAPSTLGAEFTAADGTGLSRWTFVPERFAAPWGWVVNTRSGLCLTAGDPGSSVTTQMCDGEGTRWAVHVNPDSSVSLMSGTKDMCLTAVTWSGATGGILGSCREAGSRLAVSRPATVIPDPLPDVAGYPMVGYDSGRCLTAMDTAATSGAQVQIRGCSKSAAQNWHYDPHSQGMTVFEPPITRDDGDWIDPALCLAAAGTSNSSPVRTANCQWTADGKRVPGQVWQPRGDGTWLNPVSGKCLNVQGAYTGDGSLLILWSCSTAGNAVFTPQGILKQEPVFTIRTALSGGTAFSLNASSYGVVNDDGGAIWAGRRQQWTYRESKTFPEWGMLAQDSPAGCLTAPANDQSRMTAPCSENNSTDLWKFVSQPDGTSTIVNKATGECLDLYRSSTSNGSAVGGYACNGKTNQKWELLPLWQKDPSVQPRLPREPDLNLAVFGDASQSSTSNGGDAGRANDGNRDGAFYNGSVTHTQNQANAWWQVDLGASSRVSTIVLRNRTDCCSSRLSDFWVFASNVPFNPALSPADQAKVPGVWSSRQAGTAPASLGIPVDADYRYIMVQLNGTNYLSLAEVEVLSRTPDALQVPGVDVALDGTATQSSTMEFAQSNGKASNAIDGNTDGVFLHGSLTHTVSQPRPWWQVDLGRSIPLSSVAISNRTDCCAERLSNVWILASESPFDPTLSPADQAKRAGVWSSRHAGAVSARLEVPLTGKYRYVLVQLEGTDVLSLAEVDVRSG